MNSKINIRALAVLSGLKRLFYLLNDEFKTDESDPITTPRSAEPTGTLNFVDTVYATTFIEESVLQMDHDSIGGDTNYATCPDITYDNTHLSLNYIVFNPPNSNQASGAFQHLFGFADPTDRASGGVSFLTTSVLRLFAVLNGTVITIDPNLTQSESYPVAILRRNKGVVFFYKVNNQWRLPFVLNERLSISFELFMGLYAASSTSNIVTFDNARVAKLTAQDNFPNTNWVASGDLCSAGEGAGTSYHASPDAFTEYEYAEPTKNFVWQVTMIALPPATAIWVFDSTLMSNANGPQWALSVKSDGSMALLLRLGGSRAVISTSGATLSGGETLKLVFGEETIELYYDDTLVGSTVRRTEIEGRRTGILASGGGATWSEVSYKAINNLSGLVSDYIPVTQDNDTFTHAESFIVEWEVRSIASSMWLRLQEQDDNNHILVQRQASNYLRVQKKVGGIYTELATGSTAMSAGDRIVVTYDNNTGTYKGYLNNVLEWSVTDSTFSGETSGSVEASEHNDLIVYNMYPKDDMVQALQAMERG